MTNRRQFLGLVGGGVVLAAGSGALWASTRDPEAARRPWQAASLTRQADPRRAALAYAVLAPNPHNRQPWIADLSVADEITLFCDPDRRLPETDPFDRQITIGLGCFLELLVIAAAEQGCETKVSLFPDGEPQPRLDRRPVARIAFSGHSAVARDPLFAQILDRRSNKEPYDLARPVAPSLLAEIAASARAGRVAYTDRPDEVRSLRSKTWEAMLTEITTPRTMQESVDLMRIGRAEIEANPDGIDLSGAFIEGLAAVGLLDRADLVDSRSSAFQQQLPILKAPFETAMAFMWLTTRGNGGNAQITAGRDYVRMNLQATALGVSMHPFSQALQEFPEMAPHHAAMRAELGVAEEETLQMLVRLGYGPAVKAGPRWPYESRIRSA
jgi:hypothetical protein